MVADVTAVGSPDRAEHSNFRMILGVFWSIQATVEVGEPLCFCGRRATLGYRDPLLSTNKFPSGRLMKIEWLVTDETAVRSPDRAECAILGMIFGVF